MLDTQNCLQNHIKNAKTTKSLLQSPSLPKDAPAKFCFSTAFSLNFTVKPYFHSSFSIVASEIFYMGHAQSGETNRTGRKNIFRSIHV